MNLPLHISLTRCLAHPPGHTGKGSPTTWCERLKTCARHQTISFDSFDGSATVTSRLCDDDFEAFIAVDHEAAE